MTSKAIRILMLTMIPLAILGVLIIHNNTATEANDTGKYLPPQFKPEIITSLNKVSSIISTDQFINKLLNNDKMKKIMKEINLPPESIRKMLLSKTSPVMIIYTNESGEPTYILSIIVGMPANENVMKPYTSYYANETLVKSYIIDVKVKLEGNSLSITDVSIKKNPLMNVNFGPYSMPYSINTACHQYQCSNP